MIRFRLLFRLFLRPLARDPGRTSLTVFAVGLGVAVVLAIEMAGNAATGSFLSSVETLAGRADFEVTQTGGVDGQTVARLATLPYPLKIEPRVENYAWDASKRELVPLLGLDLIAEASHAPAGAANFQWMHEKNCAWVTPGLAARPGGQIELAINDHAARFNVCGLLPRRPEGDAVVMDIALAIEEVGRGDRLDSILITVPVHSGRSLAEWEAILRGALPAGAVLKPFGAEAHENRRMLEAFRWNLEVLSFIALIVGAFLIYNNLSVSVVRRRTEIGVIRALGGTRRFILAAYLAESLLYGIIGSAVGLALGRLFASGTVRLISTTVQSLYLTSQPAPIKLSSRLILLGFAIGIGVALVSALLPAYEASQVAPVEAMARARREYEIRTRRGRLLFFAALCGAAAYGASRMPAVGGKPLFGYAAALLLLAACVLAIPACIAGLASAGSGWLRRRAGAEAYLALHGLAASLRRTSIMLAALVTAMAMTVSVGIMVGSFRKTVAVWLSNDLMADFYVQPAVPISPDRFPTLAPKIASRIAALPEVAAVDELRGYSITYQGEPTTLASDITGIAERYEHVEFLPGEPPSVIFARLRQSGWVLVSEPFATRHHIRRGARISLLLSGRHVSFRVAGIYYDYADPRGAILMDRSAMLRYLPDPAPSSLAVYLKPGVSAAGARQAVERACAGWRVSVVSNRALRSQAIEVFDRTFRITYALEAIALCVAVVGVAGALLALVWDRRRELGLLRFLGSSARQIRKLILLEASLLGVVGCALGFLLGVLLSLVLIFVINKQSFGWTIQFHWPVAVLAGAVLIVYGATLAAGLYPARLAMHLNPVDVVHDE